jgi:glutamine---fructose-6-phosphate transaminase (isomerizing)
MAKIRSFVEKELNDIPFQAKLCYEKNKGLILPEKVPYIGTGSSYFATLVLRYLGVKVFPELAGEYFHYIRKIKQFDNAVLISQSGRTTDVINCSTCFKEYTAIVNDSGAPLANQPNLKLAIPIFAGDEEYSSSKTFINTLIVLYMGHGFDVRNALGSMEQRFQEFELTGVSIGAAIVKSIKKKKVKCINIIGNGPNFGIACQAALVLSESTKFPFIGMSLTQYEHGYKETAKNAVVMVINPLKGVLYDRTHRLMDAVRNAGAKVYEINEPELDETFSPLTSIIPFFFMASFLARKLRVAEPFMVGNKVTEWMDEKIPDKI